MACTTCESSFQGGQSVVVSLHKSGSNVTVSVTNQGRHVVLIRRILLCYSRAGGQTILFLRAAPDQISWIYPSTYLEQGISATYYQLTNLPAGTSVSAQAEYLEINGRNRSCSETI
jgi:hypothetical protein